MKVTNFALPAPFLLLASLYLSTTTAAQYEILIPAYSNPCCGGGPNMWSTLIATQTNENIQLHVIFNPASGPGISVDPNYVAADGTGPLADLKNTGSVIYGYVATGYALRPTANVELEIDLYFDTLYEGLIDGIFFDEMSNDLAYTDYYVQLNSYVKTKLAGASVIGNPGLSVAINPSQQTAFSADDYGSSVDILVSFEQTAANYDTYTTPIWSNSPGSAANAHLIHTSPFTISALVNQAITNGGDFLYITDDIMPNPWDELSNGAWSALVAGALAADLTTLPGPPSETYTLPLVSSNAVSGSISNQNLSVLASLDQSGSQDSWSKYVEVSPNNSNKFISEFSFKLQPSDEAGLIGEIAISTNTIGEAKSAQHRYFEIHKYETGTWTYLGDNAAAQSWKWQEQTFTLTEPNLCKFVGPDNTILIRYSSNNAADVSNLDYLAVKVTTGAYVPPPPPPPPPFAGSWWMPKASDNPTWQWQLQGTLDTSFNVNMYDIDLFDTSASQIQALKDQGITVVCYFSAGTYEGWRPDWAQHFSFTIGGSYAGNLKPFAGKMAGWDERWLDIREIVLLAPIHYARPSAVGGRQRL
jgi:hypothetical protein